MYHIPIPPISNHRKFFFVLLKYLRTLLKRHLRVRKKREMNASQMEYSLGGTKEIFDTFCAIVMLFK